MMKRILNFVMTQLLALSFAEGLVEGKALPKTIISPVERQLPGETPSEYPQPLTQNISRIVQPIPHKQEGQGENCYGCPDSDVVTNEIHSQQEN
jgi:hypothetical protein